MAHPIFMKLKLLLALLCLSWIVAGILVYSHKESVKLLKLPPQSLAQWYKPQSKRHTWLHNMFKLRREMQAVKHYSETEQSEPLALWVERLNEHYTKIAEMVPEWENRLDPNALRQLTTAQQNNQFTQIGPALNELKKSCTSCHDRFRTVTALLYRAPDFKSMQLDEDHSLTESMKALMADVNEIKIEAEAGNQQHALASLGRLREGMDELGGLCTECHEHNPKPYPDETISGALNDLQLSLESTETGPEQTKKQSRALGMVAFTACAQCHGTHRVASDTRKLLEAQAGLIKLLKH